MKKIKNIVAILSCLFITCLSMFFFSACGSTGERPTYLGMSVSQGNPITRSARMMSYSYANPMAYRFSDEDSFKYDGDYYGKKIDDDNPFENDKTIDDEISSLVVEGADRDVYYTTPHSDIYIIINIRNPDNFEILSFTLNGKKYSNYMFEDGSTMETLVLKVNVGAEVAVQDYTIDAIKYVDGVSIKDVKMQGDKTVRIASYTEEIQPQITDLSFVNDFNSATLSFNISDEYELISKSNGNLSLLLYDGEDVIFESEVVLGDNSFTFENLKVNKIYQYAIVGAYDNLSGNGFAVNTLYKETVSTKAPVLFDKIEVGQESIKYELLWNEDWNTKELTSLTVSDGTMPADILYDNEVITETSFEKTDLRSDTVYYINGKFKNGDIEEEINLIFKTERKNIPNILLEVEKDNLNISSYEDVKFTLTEEDIDNVGSITKIELKDSNGNITVIDNDAKEISNLEKNKLYTLIVTYEYDLNNGLGVQVITLENSFYSKILISNVYNGIEYSLIEGDHLYYAVTRSEKLSSNVIILSEIAGIPVEVIRYGAFREGKFEEIVIPNSIKRIEGAAFENCMNLKFLNIPSSVNHLDIYSIVGCTNLEEINLAEGVEFIMVDNINLQELKKLKRIDLPKNLTIIPNYCFSGCSSLEEIYIPETVKTIEGAVFGGCVNLKVVYLFNNIENINAFTFHGCPEDLEIRCSFSENEKTFESGWNCNVDGFSFTVVYDYKKED